VKATDCITVVVSL